MKQLQCVFCLAVLLSLAGSGLGQQPARRPGPPAKPSSAPNSKDEEAKQQRILAVLRVRSFAERVFAFNDVSLKATTLAHLANLLWKEDEPYARQLFTKALDFYSNAVATSEVKPRATAWRRVIMLIARRDPAWAKRLTDAALASESSEQNSSQNSSSQLQTDFSIAYDMVKDNPEQAPEFAERSLRGGVNPAMHALLLQLRTRNEAAANALFLKTLDQLLGQAVVDAELMFRLGAYVFTSPKLDDPTNPTVLAFVGLRNVGLGVPDLTADRPGVPPTIVRAYLSAAKLMLRPIADPKQRQLYYVFGHFMTPKAEKFAPDLVPLIAGAMSTLAQNVPPALTDESAYANFKMTAPAGDKLEAIENIADQQTREAAYLFFTYDLWQKGDFARARTIASKIQDINTSAQLQTLIDFGEAARMLDKGSKALDEVEKRAGKMPPGLESTVLWLGIAYASIEAGETQRADEALRAALKAARSVEDARLPFLLLNAATQYASFDRAQSVATLADAVREFNARTPDALAKTNWRQRVAIDRYYREFTVKTRGLEFGFGPSIPKLAAMDIEATLAEMLKLKAEPQQAQGLMSLTAAILK
jgi:hypothetical protein